MAESIAALRMTSRCYHSNAPMYLTDMLLRSKIAPG